MNITQLAQYLQLKMEQDLVAAATDEAVTATAALITQARADAVKAKADPDVAEAAVKAVPLRPIHEDVPTLEWCARIAKKHSKAAKKKVGKLNGLRADILDRVKKDPDKKDKTPKDKTP